MSWWAKPTLLVLRQDGVGDGEQLVVAVIKELVEANVNRVIDAMAEGFAHEQVVIERALRAVAVAIAVSVAISVVAVAISVAVVAVAAVGFQQRLELAD